MGRCNKNCVHLRVVLQSAGGRRRSAVCSLADNTDRYCPPRGKYGLDSASRPRGRHQPADRSTRGWYCRNRSIGARERFELPVAPKQQRKKLWRLRYLRRGGSRGTSGQMPFASVERTRRKNLLILGQQDCIVLTTSLDASDYKYRFKLHRCPLHGPLAPLRYNRANRLPRRLHNPRPASRTNPYACCQSP